MKRPILEIAHITKLYPGVRALDDVSETFYPGEIHAIVGENGAGKSTFIKVITGAIASTSGTIVFEGNQLEVNNPQLSLKRGISAIYQEFNLFPRLSVAENIFYGRYPTRNGWVDFKEMKRQAEEIFKPLGVQIDPNIEVGNLSVGYQQIVEIAKAVSRDLKVMIMDEPTAPLTNNEVSHLFEIVKLLKSKGVCIIYISHRLEEIFEICDKVSVFRDGKRVASMLVSETEVNELVHIMVDRKLGDQFPKTCNHRTDKTLTVKNLNTSLLRNVNFDAYRGEILGFAGLVGAGRTEVARVLFGADKADSGEIYIDGIKQNFRSPRDAIASGVGLIPEDRKRQGVLLHMSIRENVTFANMKDISRFGFIKGRKETEASRKQVEALSIKTPSIGQLAGFLSGGNQQKVVLAKWMFTHSGILIFDEPTRGIDVGAKQEIYNLMQELAGEGKVVIMISSEMPELLGMADRIIVMHEGCITGVFERSEATQEKILAYSSGLIHELTNGGNGYES
jgi:ribose transport system ATP-binding protein